jgi:hypothetical protein
MQTNLWRSTASCGRLECTGPIIVDLRERATIGVDSNLLIGHLNKLIDTGVVKLLLNLADMTQLDSSGISAIVRKYVPSRLRVVT